MDWTAVEEERTWREQHYLGPDTPLRPEARATFKGLNWYPLDERYVAQAIKLRRPTTPTPAPLGSTGADTIQMMEAGILEFQLLGTPCALRAYEPAPGEADEPYILIPFQDATSAKETYGAGRYLDLEPNHHDTYDLDFNRAYHPYCAHDDTWSCTLPPPENRLPIPIQAGERL